MTTNQPTILHIEDVNKGYGDRIVLENIDLTVKQGELCTLVGPSGSGKSTLLRMILGQEFPDLGQLNIAGRPVDTPDTRRGIVYQRYSLFPHLTVLQNVALGRVLPRGILEHRRRRKEIEQEAMHYLARVRLDQHAHKFPHELSGGMQQRVAIAQSLLTRPPILLMDEPFGALDPETREEMQLFLLELWDEHRMTIFFVTHDFEEALFLGTRILVLSQYYTDDRGLNPLGGRGARIVADHALPKESNATGVKHKPEFRQLLEEIRREGFNPEVLQHVREFNLKHPDSFQTLTTEEASARSPS